MTPLQQQIETTVQSISESLTRLDTLIAAQRLQLVQLSLESERHRSISGIASAVAATTGIPKQLLLATNPRTAQVCEARFMLVWLIKRILPDLNQCDIANELMTDHSSVCKRMKRAESLYAKGGKWKVDADAIEAFVACGGEPE